MTGAKGPTEEQVFDLLESVYDAAAGASAWQSPLDRLAAITGAHTASIISPPSAKRAARVWAAKNVASDVQSIYESYYATTDVWFAEATRLGRLYTGSILRSEELVSLDELMRTEWGNDFLQPQDIRHLLTLTINSEQTLPFSPLVLSQHASAAHGPFHDAHCRLLAKLLPHLQRAFRIHQLLHDSDGPRRALDMIDKPLILVDAGGGISFMNEAARLLLQADDGLTTVGTRLAAPRQSVTNAIDRAIAATVGAAARPVAIEESLSIRVPRPSGKRNYVIDIAPLRHGTAHALARLSARAKAVVVIHDLEAMPMLDEARLRASLGLTNREAFVLRCIVEEMSTTEIAAAASLTVETVRTYIKRLLAKTGCRNQAALVKLAFGLLPHLRP